MKLRKFLFVASLIACLLGISTPAHAAIPSSERSALIALYNSTNGSGWSDNTNWLGAAGSKCFWYGVTCTGDTVTELDLSFNLLSGSIPTELENLTSLSSSFTDLGYNALWTNDATLQAFLDGKDLNWYQTQTIAPNGVGNDGTTSTSVALSWTPIEYTGDTGGYAVFVSPQPPIASIFHDGFEGGDTEWWGLGNPWVVTTDKTDTSVLVDGLEAGKTYNFVIRTVTEPSWHNNNQVISDATAPVSGTTSP